MREYPPLIFLVFLSLGLIIGVFLIIDFINGSQIIDSLWHWWTTDANWFFDYFLGIAGRLIYFLITIGLIVGVCIYAPVTVLLCLYFIIRWAFK